MNATMNSTISSKISHYLKIPDNICLVWQSLQYDKIIIHALSES